MQSCSSNQTSVHVSVRTVKFCRSDVLPILPDIGPIRCPIRSSVEPYPQTYIAISDNIGIFSFAHDCFRAIKHRYTVYTPLQVHCIYPSTSTLYIPLYKYTVYTPLQVHCIYIYPSTSTLYIHVPLYKYTVYTPLQVYPSTSTLYIPLYKYTVYTPLQVHCIYLSTSITTNGQHLAERQTCNHSIHACTMDIGKFVLEIS